MDGLLTETDWHAAPADAPPAMSALRQRAAALLRGAIRCSPLRRRVLWSLPPACGAVALTFDDGPNPEWTPRVLEVLAAHQATASFFLLGGKASEHPELVRRLAAEGHSIGSHSLSHRNLRQLSRIEAQREIRGAEEALQTILGHRPRWFRPPYGAFSPVGLWETTRRGVRTVLWNVDPRDYRSGSADRILARLGPLRAGDVVLLHDKFAGLVEALPEILARIADAGLRAASLDVATSRAA